MINIKIIGLTNNGRLALSKYRETAVDLGNYKDVTKNMSLKEKFAYIKKKAQFNLQMSAIKAVDKKGELNDLKEEYFSEEGMLIISFNPKLDVMDAIESKKNFFEQLMFHFGANADDYVIEVKEEL